MKCLVGLGNPGPQYAFNRHNIGFLVIDALARAYGDSPFKGELKALTTKVHIGNEKVLLVKPQTYMNLSGESVSSLLGYYQMALDDLLVIQDDIDQPYHGVRFHKNRGSGGHNGIKSLNQHLGGENYARLKLGVGRPSHPAQDVAAYVLENFSKQEMAELPDFIEHAIDAIEMFLAQGFDRAANQYNSSAKGT
jgi:PTH1 family peptidyl-tRNA hydrolase